MIGVGSIEENLNSLNQLSPLSPFLVVYKKLVPNRCGSDTMVENRGAVDGSWG